MTMNKVERGSAQEMELIESYRKSEDQSILATVYEPYIKLVFGLCLKYFKEPARAEDAVMDIYLAISKKLLTHNVKNFKSWLYVVSKNHCLDKLRSQKSKIPKEKEAQLMYSDDVFHPDYDDHAEEEIKRLKRCIENLPSNQKEIIDLFYYQKISYQEITETTSYTWSQVRSYIQNGRRNLKRCLEGK